jgi:hypothetical protein
LLDDLPNELVLLDKLTELKVDGNPMKNIPDADQGGNAVFHFLLKRYKGTHAAHDTRDTKVSVWVRVGGLRKKRFLRCVHTAAKKAGKKTTAK